MNALNRVKGLGRSDKHFRGVAHRIWGLRSRTHLRDLTGAGRRASRNRFLKIRVPYVSPKP